MDRVTKECEYQKLIEKFREDMMKINSGSQPYILTLLSEAVGIARSTAPTDITALLVLQKALKDISNIYFCYDEHKRNMEDKHEDI